MDLTTSHNHPLSTTPRVATAAPAPLSFCPGCGHQWTPQTPCLHCRFDPMRGGRGADASGFADLTPVGTARLEGAFIATLLRWLLTTWREGRRPSRRP